MRSKSEELMLRIREYIESYFERYSSTPTVREIAGAMKIAVSSAHRYLVAMAEKDMVSYLRQPDRFRPCIWHLNWLQTKHTSALSELLTRI